MLKILKIVLAMDPAPAAIPVKITRKIAVHFKKLYIDYVNLMPKK